MSRVRPTYGMGFFFVRETGLVEEVIVFDYYDPDEVYKLIVQNEEKLKEEKNTLAKNMQFYLDSEEVKINSKPVHPKVVGVDIGFRGSYKRPYIIFFIAFIGEFRRGVNTYEDWYEPEIAEYDYSAVWLFPTKARVLRADLGVPFTLIDGRILMFSVSSGSQIRGYERIDFEVAG